MTTRNDAVDALLTVLGRATWGSPAVGFGVKTRRNLSETQMATVGSPGLALMVHHGAYDRQALNIPPRRTITVAAMVYVSVGSDVTVNPDALLNDIEDALNTIMKPDSPTGFCTLGGKVPQCGFRGEMLRAPGEKTGYGLMVLPIDIVLP